MEGNGFQIYSDEPVFRGNIEEVVVYRFSQTIEGIDLVLFASKNGAFLLQRYLEVLPGSKQLILLFLDDVDFEDLLRDYHYTSELTDEIIMSTRAATLDNKAFYRASTSIEELLTEAIHEGSHVVDNLLKEQVLSEGKTLKEIEKIIGSNWDQEISAYSHERDWHKKVGRDPEYKSLNDIKKHVKTVYTKY